MQCKNGHERLYPGDEIELVVKGTIRKVHLDSEDKIIFTISNLNPSISLGSYWQNGMLQISENELRKCLFERDKQGDA